MKCLLKKPATFLQLFITNKLKKNYLPKEQTVFGLQEVNKQEVQTLAQ